MSGGQGSGLRMNEAEISRIVGGRSHWQDLQAAIQKWSTNPATANSITEDQRGQIRALADTVGNKLSQQLQTINEARNGLAGTNDPMQHRQILNQAQQKLAALNTPAQRGTGNAPGTVKLQAPDGSVRYVPPDQVDHYVSLGAKQVQ
jgi:hypothetical protein